MEPMKLLLIDDEEQFVTTLAERLEIRGLAPRVAFSGEDGLRQIKRAEPDVVVLDLRMPGMGGLDVLKMVKETRPRVEVIILTGHGAKQDEEATRRLGAFDYLQKPVDIDQLLEVVRDAHRNKRERAETVEA